MCPNHMHNGHLGHLIKPLKIGGLAILGCREVSIHYKVSTTLVDQSVNRSQSAKSIPVRQ